MICGKTLGDKSMVVEIGFNTSGKMKGTIMENFGADLTDSSK